MATGAINSNGGWFSLWPDFRTEWDFFVSFFFSDSADELKRKLKQEVAEPDQQKEIATPSGRWSVQQ